MDVIELAASFLLMGDESRSTHRAEGVPVKPKVLQSRVMVFSWGYKGWGNHTRELVRMVDAVESARGFGPPMFIDVRLRRQVRALGFRDRAFEGLLGPERYLWIPGLGNAAIGDASLDSMQLLDPDAIHILIGRVLEQMQHKRRVIFFCSCESPAARDTCHRGLVVEHLVKTTEKCGLAVSVQEWPGGAPIVGTINVSLEKLREVRQSNFWEVRVPIPPSVELANAGAIPHHSILRCRHGDEQVFASAGPAVCTSRGWVLPLWNASEDIDDVRSFCEEKREELELDPFGAPVRALHWQEHDLRKSSLKRGVSRSTR